MTFKRLRWLVRKRRYIYRNPKKVMFGAVLTAWLATLVILMLLFAGDNQNGWAHRGQFGDMFGAVNALFSGLAFGGIILTIILQKEELRLQRKELGETRNEFKTQNATLKLQQFENTFFKLLELHFQVVQDVSLRSDTNAINGQKGRNAFAIILEILKKRIQAWNYDPKINNNSYEEINDGFATTFLSTEQLYKPFISFCKSLNRIYSFVETSPSIATDNKFTYYSFIYSSISEDEKTLLFYFLTFFPLEDDDLIKPLLEIQMSEQFFFDDVTDDYFVFHPSHRNLMHTWVDRYTAAYG
jgi:hypothetical protein